MKSTENVTKRQCKGLLATGEIAVRSLDGVQDAQVSLDDKQVELSYEEDRVSLQAIKQAFREAGYQPQ